MNEILTNLKAILNSSPAWERETKLREYVKELEKDGGRTSAQNNSLHLYLKMLSQELNEAGLDMKQVVKVDIEWNTVNAKEYLWRPIQKALLKKDSTTRLKKSEVSRVYEHLNRLTAEKWGISIPFPSDETERKEEEKLIDKQLQADKEDEKDAPNPDNIPW